MKPISATNVPAPNAPVDVKLNWCIQMITAICQASQRPTEQVYDAFQITNVPNPPVRALNVTTATAADVAKVLGTLINDHHRRGPKSGRA